MPGRHRPVRHRLCGHLIPVPWLVRRRVGRLERRRDRRDHWPAGGRGLGWRLSGERRRDPSPRAGWLGSYIERCPLPDSEHSLCTAALDNLCWPTART